MTPREVALRERVEELEEEVRQLREERVTAEVSAIAAPLTRQQREIFALLISRTEVSNDAIATVMSDRVVGPNGVKVRICAMRKRLAGTGVQIETVQGIGYRIPAEQRKSINAGAMQLGDTA